MMEGQAQRPFCDEIFSHGLRTLRPKLVGVALRILGNAEDAEDAVQEALWKAFRARHRFRGESTWRTWLTRITMNESLSQLRRRRVHFSLDTESATYASADWREASGSSPETIFGSRQLAFLVHEALGKVNRKNRMALRLREFDDFSYRQIAQALNLPVGTVKVRIHRGKKELGRILRRRLSVRNGKAGGRSRVSSQGKFLQPSRDFPS